MKIVLLIIFALLPILIKAQNGSPAKPLKCTFTTNGIDSFTGKLKKTSEWFSITGKSQPTIQAQFIQEGYNYFIHLIVIPQDFKLHSQEGYNEPDANNGNALMVKLANEEVLTFHFMTKQTYSKVAINVTTIYYSAVYSINKEQLDLLVWQDVIKLRVYHDQGFYYYISPDTESITALKEKAACMLK